MKDQGALFDVGKWWETAWRGMPEFIQEEQKPHHSLQVLLRSDADAERFQDLAGHANHGKWMWYPNQKYKRWSVINRYVSPVTLPRYPVYIISKGRYSFELRTTSRTLESLGIPYSIVVEPQEADAYRAAVDPRWATVLVLPFSNLGLGSIPARNWVWEHALSSGAARHWIMDDNIQGFYRLNRNMKIQGNSGAMFRAAEDFVDRYSNVAISGLQYEFFAMRRNAYDPFALNTRIYSCILIKNDLPYRWRGRYNEDTDLSLRALKDGWCTVLFYAFLAKKMGTMMMRGGNTDELYAGAGRKAHHVNAGAQEAVKEEDGRWKMAEALRVLHPDVTTIVRKWDRWQHQVDYTPFAKNELLLRADAVIPEGVNDYGMVLTRLDGAEEPEEEPEEEPRPVARVTPVALVAAACGHAWNERLCPTCTPAPVGPVPKKQQSIITAEVLARPVPKDWTPDAPPQLRSRGIKLAAVDYETTGLQWWRPEVRPVGCGVAWEEDGKVQSRYLAWGHRGGNGLTEENARAWMKDELAGLEIVNLNTVFDAHISQEWGVDWDALGCRLRDVAHYAALLDDHRGEGWRRKEKPFSLDAIALDYLGERKSGEDLDKSRMADYHTHQVDDYGRRDASLALRVLQAQEQRLREEDLLDVVALEDSIIPVVVEMERNAARIDVEKLHAWVKQSEEDLQALRFKLWRDVGWDVNPDSPDHMARLFREQGLKSDAETETGRESFAADVLGRNANNPVVARVIKVARLADLRSKFLVPYSQAVGADGLLRFSFHQLKGDKYGTVSGRFSATKPTGATRGANVQQVFSVENQLRMHCVDCAADAEWGKRKNKLPRHYAEHGQAYLIRELFIPDPGTDLAASDAKQIEYRTFAHLSRSARLLKAYQDNPETDFHEWTGELVRAHRPDFDRKKLKIFNFMLLFGAGAGATADMMGISEEEGKELRDVYFKVFPEVPELMNLAMDVAFTPGRFRRRMVDGDWITASAEGRGYVKTIAGRRARFPEAKRLHAALNRAVSGSAADLNKMKLRTLYRERKALGIKLRLTVHDEVVADLPGEQLPAFKRVMDVQETPLLVPILWSSVIAKNWAEAK